MDESNHHYAQYDGEDDAHESPPAPLAQDQQAEEVAANGTAQQA